MHVDRPVIAIEARAPDALEQLAARPNSAGKPQEEEEEVEFTRLETDLLGVDPSPAHLGIGRDVAARHREARLYRRRATEHAADPSEKLRSPERFDDVIISADVEAADDLLGLVARGEDDHGDEIPVETQLSAEVESVPVREPEVEQHEIELS